MLIINLIPVIFCKDTTFFCCLNYDFRKIFTKLAELSFENFATNFAYDDLFQKKVVSLQKFYFDSDFTVKSV